MTNINIIMPIDLGTHLSVTFDGECNHGGKYEDELDYGYPSHEKCDWVDDWHNSWVCDKCDWSELIEPEEPEYERED